MVEFKRVISETPGEHQAPLDITLTSLSGLEAREIKSGYPTCNEQHTNEKIEDSAVSLVTSVQAYRHNSSTSSVAAVPILFRPNIRALTRLLLL